MPNDRVPTDQKSFTSCSLLYNVRFGDTSAVDDGGASANIVLIQPYLRTMIQGRSAKVVEGAIRLESSHSEESFQVKRENDLVVRQALRS